VNRAFRTADIDIIYQFRFIIAEIHDQLASLPRPSTADLVVYRGQIISTAELRIIEKNQKKGFISMNTFLSTTDDYNQAVRFSGIGTGSLPDGLESVVYQITVGQTRQPFANISSLSTISTENEILFSIGTVFRIDSVEDWPCGWLVSLTLTTEVEERFEILMNHFRDEIGQKPTLAMLGKFLMMQGDYSRAQRYFQFLLDQNELNLDDQGRVICYTYLANILDEKGEYEQAMTYHQQILDIQQRSLGSDDPYFSQIYNNMAATQMALGQYNDATKNFQLSLSIDLQCQPQDKSGIATSYNNVAFMYNEMEDYPKSAEYYEKALEKQLKLGLDTLKHPDIAITYHNLGSLYDDMKQHTKAIDYYEKALVIQKTSLPPEHPSRTITESSIAMAYLQLNNHTLALEKCQAALDSKLKIHPPNFPSLSKSYMNLGYIYSDLGDFIKAEAQYKIALQIRECHLPNNHPETGTNHQLLGDLYDEMGKTDKALIHYQRALDIFQHQDLSNLVALGKAYTNLGSVERDSLKATEYLKQGVATLLSADVIDKRQLAVAYNALGTGHQKTDQLEEALTNYTKALDIGLELVNNDENDPSLSTFYCNLGSTFTQQDNVEKGLEYTHKALTISLKIRDPCHPTLGTIYDTLGDCYDKLEKWDRAVEFYQKAVDVYKQPNAQNLRLLVEAYLNMASMYESMNDLAKAIEYYKMALDLQLENLDSDDPDLVTTYWFLASSYQE
jgi:tetratricopeptide (TPR) repeat protein